MKDKNEFKIPKAIEHRIQQIPAPILEIVAKVIKEEKQFIRDSYLDRLETTQDLIVAVMTHYRKK